MTTGTMERTQEMFRTDERSDMAETMLRSVDERTTKATGTSIFHILTIIAIAGSIALFLTGRERAGIFVGLWPPTFQALKAAAENK